MPTRNVYDPPAFRNGSPAADRLSEAIVEAIENAYATGALPDPPAWVISGTPPPTAKVGVPYSFTPTLSGGLPAPNPPIPLFTLYGTLPPGLTCDRNTGTISGVPSYFQNQAGVAVYPGILLQASDKNWRVGQFDPIALPKFTITVAA